MINKRNRFFIVLLCMALCVGSAGCGPSKKSEKKEGNKKNKTKESREKGDDFEESKVDSYVKINQGMVFTAAELSKYVDSAEDPFRVYAIKEGDRFTVVCTSLLPENTKDPFKNNKNAHKIAEENDMYFTTSEIMQLKGNQELVVFSNRETSLKHAMVKPVISMLKTVPFVLHKCGDKYEWFDFQHTYIRNWVIDGDYNGKHISVLEIDGVDIQKCQEYVLYEEAIHGGIEYSCTFATDKDTCKVGYMDGTTFKEFTVPSAYYVISKRVENGTDTGTPTRDGYIILGNSEQLYNFVKSDGVSPQNNIISLDNKGLLKLNLK